MSTNEPIDESADSPRIEVDMWYLGKLIGLMLTVVDATVPEENKKATKDLVKQLIRTWFNDSVTDNHRIADLGGLGEK